MRAKPGGGGGNEWMRWVGGGMMGEGGEVK